MFRHLAMSVALAASLALPITTSAQAAIGDGALGARLALANSPSLHNVQFIFGGRNYCWYEGGWRGPGWYWCGYAGNNGYGWGGGYGWQGWRAARAQSGRPALGFPGRGYHPGVSPRPGGGFHPGGGARPGGGGRPGRGFHPGAGARPGKR